MSVKDKDRVLTSKGYAIKKTFLDEIKIKKLKSSLTMSPKEDKFKKTQFIIAFYR